MPDFEPILDLALDQMDRSESAITEDANDVDEARNTCTRRLSVRLANQIERLPWRPAPGGQVVDRSQRRAVSKGVQQMLDSVDDEFRRLERDLLRPELRGF